MPVRKRRPFDDGRDGSGGDAPGCPISGLDSIPSKQLPPEVEFLFFGGGWFPLYEFVLRQGYRNAHYAFVSPFYISLRPVSVRQWEKVMGDYDSDGLEDEDAEYVDDPQDFPADVGWDDALEYCNERGELEGLQPCYDLDGDPVICDWNANGYRLPTEAELNYATPGHRRRLPAKPALGPRELDIAALNIPPADLSEFDLIDFIWRTIVWDLYDRDYFATGPVIDPTGPKTTPNMLPACRLYVDRPLMVKHWGKPLREEYPGGEICQFYVARSWMFKDAVRLNNQLNSIPQWDR